MEEHKEKKTYWPLIAVIIVSILMGLALSMYESAFLFMRYFLGSFLCLISLVKLFDLKGFHMAFMEYDLLAKRVGFYGWIYPFIELALGLGFFAGKYLIAVSFLTFLILGFGAFGVFQAMKDKKEITCACMGSVLKVPLTTVSLIEDVVMSLMALAMCFMQLF